MLFGELDVLVGGMLRLEWEARSLMPVGERSAVYTVAVGIACCEGACCVAPCDWLAIEIGCTGSVDGSWQCSSGPLIIGKIPACAWISVRSADVWLRGLEACWVASRYWPVAEVGCTNSMCGS